MSRARNLPEGISRTLFAEGEMAGDLPLLLGAQCVLGPGLARLCIDISLQLSGLAPRLASLHVFA